MKSLALETLSKFGDITVAGPDERLEAAARDLVRIKQGHDVIVLHRDAVPDFIRCIARVVEA